MNMKLKNAEVNPAFADLFSYKTKEEKAEHDAQMISYRILSEIEVICEQKKIKKKDLADMLGTSRSYITQLFRGMKQVNTYIMAKMEDALDLSFEVKAKLNNETHEEFIGKQLTPDLVRKRGFHANGYVWFCFQDKSTTRTTNEFVEKMETEARKMETKSSYLQKAV